MMILNQDFDASLRHKFALLYACASQDFSPQHLEHICVLVEQGPDWDDFLKAITRHQVVPLVYQSLKRACWEQLPSAVADSLKRHCQVNGLKNLFLDSQLTAILTLFEAAKIPVLAYKGPLLAKQAYGSLSLREFSDLDLLVRPQDFQKTEEMLTHEGYHSSMYLAWETHYISSDAQVNIDLHQSLVPEFFGIPNHFIDPSQGELSLESLLLLLCLQCVKDCCHWRLRLGQLCDVAEFLRSHPQLNFSEVQRQAQKFGLQRILWVILIFVYEQLGVELPVQIETQLAPKRLEYQLANWINLRLVLSTEDSPLEPLEKGFLHYVMSCNHQFYLKIRERPRDKILYCWYWFSHIVWVCVRPSKVDQSLVNLPPVLQFLYYPIHSLRLLYKYGVMLAIATVQRESPK